MRPGRPWTAAAAVVFVATGAIAWTGLGRPPAWYFAFPPGPPPPPREWDAALLEDVEFVRIPAGRHRLDGGEAPVTFAQNLGDCLRTGKIPFGGPTRWYYVRRPTWVAVHWRHDRLSTLPPLRERLPEAFRPVTPEEEELSRTSWRLHNYGNWEICCEQEPLPLVFEPPIGEELLLVQSQGLVDDHEGVLLPWEDPGTIELR